MTSTPTQLKKLKLLLLCVGWVFFSCKSEESNNKTHSETIDTQSSKQILSKLKSDEILGEIYSQDLFWLSKNLHINHQGNELLNIINTAFSYGFNPEWFDSNRLNSLIKTSNHPDSALVLEKKLTQNYLLLGKFLQEGIIDTTVFKYEFYSKKKVLSPKKLLQDADTNNVQQLLDMQPKSVEYITLRKQLEKYLTNRIINDSIIIVPEYKKDSTTSYNLAEKSLQYHGYLKDTLHSKKEILSAIAQFQLNHGLTPDSIIGKNTARALSSTLFKDIIKCAVTFQKLRWEDNWNQPYIIANIPGYDIKIIHQNKIILQKNVVVGVIGKETPELDSKLSYMVIYPFWNVPYSIKTEEIIPKLQKDSTYLIRNGYELIIGGKTVPYSSLSKEMILSGNLPYKIRQKGGKSNALGLVKFIFPNKHSVYFHDTPSKRFFYNDIRAYSHGCVRVEDPLAITEKILELDNQPISIDSVKSLIKNQERKTITLTNKIPVHIRYFTASATEQNIFFHFDVYNKDTELISIFEKLFVKIALN